MVGGLIFGYLADKFGRKKIMLVTLFTPVAIGVLTALVKTYYLFVGLRFLQGIFIQVMLILERLHHMKTYHAYYY